MAQYSGYTCLSSARPHTITPNYIVVVQTEVYPLALFHVVFLYKLVIYEPTHTEIRWLAPAGYFTNHEQVITVPPLLAKSLMCEVSPRNRYVHVCCSAGRHKCILTNLRTQSCRARISPQCMRTTVYAYHAQLITHTYLHTRTWQHCLDRSYLCGVTYLYSSVCACAHTFTCRYGAGLPVRSPPVTLEVNANDTSNKALIDQYGNLLVQAQKMVFGKVRIRTNNAIHLRARGASHSRLDRYVLSEHASMFTHRPAHS